MQQYVSGIVGVVAEKYRPTWNEGAQRMHPSWETAPSYLYTLFDNNVKCGRLLSFAWLGRWSVTN